MAEIQVVGGAMVATSSMHLAMAALPAAAALAAARVAWFGVPAAAGDWLR
jgi:hypothetical protein